MGWKRVERRGGEGRVKGVRKNMVMSLKASPTK